MEEEKKKAYSEVVEVLKLIENEEKIEQIPFEVIQLIKTNSDPTYKPNISKEVPLEEQELMDETYHILGWIANKYWGEDIEIKKTFADKEDMEENKEEFKNTIEDIEEFDINSVDTSKIRNASVYNDIEPECLEGRNLPALVSNMNWFEKIKEKVIKFFKLLFKLNSKEKEGVNE